MSDESTGSGNAFVICIGILVTIMCAAAVINPDNSDDDKIVAMIGTGIGIIIWCAAVGKTAEKGKGSEKSKATRQPARGPEGFAGQVLYRTAVGVMSGIILLALGLKGEITLIVSVVVGVVAPNIDGG